MGVTSRVNSSVDRHRLRLDGGNDDVSGLGLGRGLQRRHWQRAFQISDVDHVKKECVSLFSLCESQTWTGPKRVRVPVSAP